MAAQVCAGKGQDLPLWPLSIMHSGSAKMEAEDETGGSWILPRLTTVPSYSLVCLEGSRGNRFIRALFQIQFELGDFEDAGELIY